MVMQSYSTTVYGQRVSTGSSPSSNTVVNVPVASRQLSGITSVNGDRVTPNPHSYRLFTSRLPVGTVYSKQGTVWNQVTGPVGQTPQASGFHAVSSGAARNLALADMYSKLRGEVDLSVDLVQWRKTLEMMSLYRRFVVGVARSAKNLIPQVDNIRGLQRDLTDARRAGKRSKRIARELNGALNTLAVARLEYVYGWSPTMGTLKDLYEQAINPGAPGLMRMEGYGRQNTTTQSKRPLFTGSKVQQTFTNVFDERVNFVCYFNPPPSVMTNLAKISSLNPVSVLYEATPFSFVLDWITDFSGFIRTLETAFVHRNSFVTGYVTTRTKSVVYGRTSGIEFVNDNLWTRYDYTENDTQFRKDRYRLTSAPYPRSPVKATSFGVERQLNAIALAKVTLLKADDLLKWRR